MKILLTWGDVPGHGSARNHRDRIIGFCKDAGVEFVTPQEKIEGSSSRSDVGLYLHAVCGCCPHSTNFSNIEPVGYAGIGPTMLFVTTENGHETTYSPWIIRIRDKAHFIDILVKYGK